MDGTDPSTAATPAVPPIPPEQHSALLDELGTLVNQSGGVAGMAQQFEQKGLGGLMSGWVANGANPGINGQQIVQALGQDKVTELAGKVGLSEAQVASGISTLLPMLINELTPNGTVPPHDSGAVDSVLGMLKSKLF